MPIYDIECPEHGRQERFIKPGNVRRDERGYVLVPCRACGQDLYPMPSLTCVHTQEDHNSIEVSGQKFKSWQAAEAHAKANNLQLMHPKDRDYKEMKARVREGTDAWYRSQGFADKDDARRQRQRNPNLGRELAEAAKDRERRTGTTDSSGKVFRSQQAKAP